MHSIITKTVWKSGMVVVTSNAVALGGTAPDIVIQLLYFVVQAHVPPTGRQGIDCYNSTWATTLYLGDKVVVIFTHIIDIFVRQIITTTSQMNIFWLTSII